MCRIYREAVREPSPGFSLGLEFGHFQAASEPICGVSFLRSGFGYPIQGGGLNGGARPIDGR
jgi:hypothetical protein